AAGSTAVAGATAAAGSAVAKGRAAVAGSVAKGASNATLTAANLRDALLTRVNGVAAAGPATSGSYSSMVAEGSKRTAGIQVSPKSCTGAATIGFDPAALGASPAAATTFRVGTNGVSEVLIASPAKSASSALAGTMPAECATYKETIDGKAYTYGIKEKNVSGIGEQARVLNVHSVGAKADSLWSLIYQAKGFIGTVTVVGPNATEQAVTELGKQAYAYAAKSLS
ncbi:MAG: hypothetical protein ACRDNS_13750, partial [Trebonia sp.]